MRLSPGTTSQICYATFDLRLAAQNWARAAGAGPFFLMELPADLEKTYRGEPAHDSFQAAIGFMGTTCIELMQPTNEAPSMIREILDPRGEGAVQHMYPHIRPLDAGQYDEMCAKYKAMGFEEALSFRVPGMGRNAFSMQRALSGAFLKCSSSAPTHTNRCSVACMNLIATGMEATPFAAWIHFKEHRHAVQTTSRRP